MPVFLCLLNGITISQRRFRSYLFFFTVLFWFLKEVSNSILSTVLFLCPVTPFIFASDYCDSVLCLVGQGVQFDDVSLMELEDVLEQKLLERWNSCGNAGIL